MFKTALKFLGAAAIIYWMYDSGKLDFTLVKKAFSSGSIAYLGVVLIITQAALSSVRWKWLLDLKASKPIKPFAALNLTWIGLLFNTVLPGAVSGDLLKLVYAKDLDKNFDRSFLFSSVLIDRILGLIGLLFLMGLFTIFDYKEMVAISPQMKGLISFNFILFLGSIVFITLLFLPKKIREPILQILNKIPAIGPKVANVMEQVWHIGKSKKTTIKCLLFSMLLQFSNIMAFWLLTKGFYGKDLSLTQAFTFIPIGLIAVAVPISPSGAGVGHLIFNELFSYAGISNGASLFNIFFVVVVFNNLLGVIPFLFFGKQHNLKEAEEFEHGTN
ncbi:lysylphosphatidylglycerol synthase transmembrane domain-containing protein [Halobacteriovorax sp. GB3]|uniref:lysylphosphatidylglycerol synthase transmembrane domain-containing protein n=1 Tax=Halobacteriovorax sp. GB3 TaxID=2719615 RepID=UPI00235E1E37|nr:lysylphosphatidylglycerol synthase transmembrane domain-containing protein [Halobacteriovorax sp. GB3]MDD0852621.1 lysylphosphatidylglycerol synthase transmembrane domain-containing protein [Halobacteriovorax sp. GB3]